MVVDLQQAHTATYTHQEGGEGRSGSLVAGRESVQSVVRSVGGLCEGLCDCVLWFGSAMVTDRFVPVYLIVHEWGGFEDNKDRLMHTLCFYYNCRTAFAFCEERFFSVVYFGFWGSFLAGVAILRTLI